tara:strand:- start:142 stop:324 length:183 start_codon:yes stop_codon:yes gene_type:complete
MNFKPSDFFKEMYSSKPLLTFAPGWLFGISALLLAAIALLSVIYLNYSNFSICPKYIFQS